MMQFQLYANIRENRPIAQLSVSFYVVNGHVSGKNRLHESHLGDATYCRGDRMQTFDSGLEMPIGMAMLVAQDVAFQDLFGGMSLDQRRGAIAGSRGLGSQDEMRTYLQSLLR